MPTEYTLCDGRTLTLRSPAPDDAAALVMFHKRVGGESDFLLSDENGIFGLTEQIERAYLKETLSMPNTRMLLAVKDEEIVGLADVRAEQRPRLKHIGSVGIVVRKDCWHVGAGHILMRSLVEFARENEVLTRLELTVRADNDRAIRLYREFGFTEYGLAHRYMCVSGAYFDMLQMELLL